MLRIRVYAAVAVMLVAVPLAASAQGTPEVSPTAGCAFPPISIELLREIRDDIAANPPPTPTTAADGYSSSRTHLIQFPPPAGEPLDAATAESIKRFFDDYETCLVVGDIPTTYGAWTEGFIRRTIGRNLEFVEGLIAAIEADRDAWPHPGLSLLLLRAWEIDTGHVVAVVQIVGVPETWTMLLMPMGDSWLIDDLWSVPMRMLEDSLTGPVYGTPIADDSLIETDFATAVAAD